MNPTPAVKIDCMEEARASKIDPSDRTQQLIVRAGIAIEIVLKKL